METVRHGISLPAASRFTDAFASTSCSTPQWRAFQDQSTQLLCSDDGCVLKHPRISFQVLSGCQQLPINSWSPSSTYKHVYSVGRQSQHCKICRHPCNRWQPEKANLKGNGKEQSRIVTGALPTVVTGAATALIVGGAIFALTRLNKDSLPVLETKKECEVCGGSGVCPTCNGEGFVNKNLSTEAAARARARAKDAATRYTAGLAKKWNYCATCAGQRGCQSCDGRGWVR